MDDGVELPGSSYDQIVRIIQGYQRSSVDQKFSNSDVEKSTGVAASDVSRNGKFLVQVGVLEGSQRKYLSEAGSRLCRAYQFDLAREVSEIWRKLLATTDFTSKMISAVRIRKGMDLKDFQAHVAYSAGSNKTNIKTGAATFVRLLEIANLVSTENGIVAALPASDSAASSGSVQEQDDRSDQRNQSGADVRREITNDHPLNTAQASDLQIQLQIVVNVQAEWDDFGRLPELIRNLKKDIEDIQESIEVNQGPDVRVDVDLGSPE